jgi:transposase InsO family protein
MERFSHRECKAQGRTIKYEDIYPSSYETIKEARDGIKKYMNIYNKERQHCRIDYLTPCSEAESTLANEAYYKGANNRCYNAKKMLLEVA